MAAPPNKTLYVNNLNDKVTKDELRSQLYALFTTYGKIIDIVALKGSKMKGQAFLVFADQAGATTAMRACEGMLFYDKPMVRTLSRRVSTLLTSSQAHRIRQKQVLRNPLARGPQLCPAKRRQRQLHRAPEREEGKGGGWRRPAAGQARKVG